jgi:alkylation response protein AidB-like acyl-CoA dehydrogenase
MLAYCGTVTKLLWETKRADLIDRYVRPMASGECFGGFAWSEGTTPFRSQPAEARWSRWVLDGRKCPIADGQIAELVMTFAKNAGRAHSRCGVGVRPHVSVWVRPHVSVSAG